MFNVNLLNKPGRQTDMTEHKIIVSLEENSLNRDNKSENNKLKAEEKKISTGFKIVLFLILIIFVIGYYYLIIP